MGCARADEEPKSKVGVCRRAYVSDVYSHMSEYVETQV